MIFKNKMKLYIYVCAVLSLFAIPHLSSANSGVNVTVEIVKASPNDTFVSPELKELAQEVSPVLNFKGFKLIKKSEFPLNSNQSNELLLTQDRIMVITLEGFENDQARLKIKILKYKKEVFATTLLLIDDGKAILGGPTIPNGVMLLRVGGKFIK